MVKRTPRARPEGVKYWYEGSLSSSGDGLVRKALQSWCGQIERCTKPNSKKWRYYGAKGIGVLYRSREFVGWWLEQQKNLRLKRPTVSRIDHDKDYCFENIRLEEFMDNCVHDVLKRHGAPGLKKKKRVYCFDRINIRVLRFRSTHDAARSTGVDQRNISTIARRKPRKNGATYDWTGSGLTFRYDLHTWLYGVS